MHLSSEKIAQAFKNACLAELQAIKPGNVHIFADGHGMVVQDFIKSAEAAAQVFSLPNLTVGELILKAVQATQEAVSCNTNLGIILLCAIIAKANSAESAADLKNNIAKTLSLLNQSDASLAYSAIRLANPAGLGQVDQFDVHQPPALNNNVTLLLAMQAAPAYDLIAQQYANGFTDVLQVGLVSYQNAITKWQNSSWAVTYCYLIFLATFADSHIVRKHGINHANQIQREAKQHLQAIWVLDNPKLYLRALLAWDADLKLRKINPGTSADLTVATLMAIELMSKS